MSRRSKTFRKALGALAFAWGACAPGNPLRAQLSPPAQLSGLREEAQNLRTFKDPKLPLLSYVRAPTARVVAKEKDAYKVDFSWEPRGEDRHPDPNGTLHVYVRSKDDARPFILILPVTGNGESKTARRACGRLNEEGFRCAYLERRLSGKKSGPSNMDEIFNLPGLPPCSAETARRGLDALEDAGFLSPGGKIGVGGMSMGAIDASLLALTDDRVAAAALILGGADLPEILAHMDGAGVRGFVAFRKKQMKANAWSVEDFRREIEKRAYVGDPLAYLKAVPGGGRLSGDRFLMINVRGDSVIPNRASEELYAALSRGNGGRPDFRYMRTPLVLSRYKHVLSLLRLPYLTGEMAKHFKKFLS